MADPIHGVIHGKTVELTKNPGMADGQEVEVVLRPLPSQAAWGEGIRRSAGALANYPEMDHDIEEIQRQRKIAAHRDVAE